MASFNVQLNSRPRQDGRHLLMIRITTNRKHEYRSIERYVRKQDFNSKAKYGHWIRTNCSEHKALNEFIATAIRTLERGEDPTTNGEGPKVTRINQPIILDASTVPDKKTKTITFACFTQKEIE